MWEGRLRDDFPIGPASMHFNHMHLHTSRPLRVIRGFLYLKLCRAILHSRIVSRFHFACVSSDLLVLASRTLYGKENYWPSQDSAGENVWLISDVCFGVRIRELEECPVFAETFHAINCGQSLLPKSVLRQCHHLWNYLYSMNT